MFRAALGTTGQRRLGRRRQPGTFVSDAANSNALPSARRRRQPSRYVRSAAPDNKRL
jgi:hypothetical protein